MFRIIYDVSWTLIYWLLHIPAFFSKKINLWVKGRKTWAKPFHNLPSGQVWFHLASLGEYEQAIEVIKKCEAEYGKHKVSITFFSPSGYEQVKSMHQHVGYLPLDRSRDIRRLYELLQPSICILTKYDFWYNVLRIAEQREVPTLVMAAKYDEDKYYFKWYGKWMLNRLRNIRMTYTLDEASANLAKKHQIPNVDIAGDPRVERSMSLLAISFVDDKIKFFKGDHNLLILASTHSEDLVLLAQTLSESLPSSWKCLVVPHEVNASAIRNTQKYLPPTVLYSEYGSQQSRFMVLDGIGKLKWIYRYADAAYVGGGLGAGVHNLLEPAVYGIPLACGPKTHGFPEAQYFKDNGALLIVNNASDAREKIKQLLQPQFKQTSKKVYSSYFEKAKGASNTIFMAIKALVK